MKRSKEEISKANKFLDEAIKLGVQLDLEKEDGEPILTDEDMHRLGIPLPPDDMYERIMNAYDTEKKQGAKKVRFKKLILVAVVLTMVIASALSVQAVRVYLYQIGVHIMENGANLMGLNRGEPDVFDLEDEEAYKQAEETLQHKLLKPDYLPKGFKFQELKIYGDYKVRLLFTSDDSIKTVRFEQQIISGEIGSGTILDTKTPIVFQDSINGYDVTIGELIQAETNATQLIGIWSDDELIYIIDTNLDKEELIKIIKSLK